jgi:hypothetical protein
MRRKTAQPARLRHRDRPTERSGRVRWFPGTPTGLPAGRLGGRQPLAEGVQAVTRAGAAVADLRYERAVLGREGDAESLLDGPRLRLGERRGEVVIVPLGPEAFQCWVSGSQPVQHLLHGFPCRTHALPR